MNYSQLGNGNCSPSAIGFGRSPEARTSSTRMYSRPANNGGCGPYTTMSSPNTYAGGQQYVYQQQGQGSGRQQVGRACRRGPNRMPQVMQPQMMKSLAMTPMPQHLGTKCDQSQGGAAPNAYAKPCAPINVNVSAATLAAAKNTSTIADRGECSVDGNPDVKYISLNWEDILGKGGMNGMRVSMVPSGDPSNQNRQLKVAFGGGQHLAQSGETPLRVVSFQPVTPGQMVSKGGNAGSQQNAMNFTVGSQLAAQNQLQMGNRSASGCSCPNCR